MTDEQLQGLDEGFRKTSAYREIKQETDEIINDLEGLKEGQENLRKDVETGFEKGRKRMDGMEEEMKEIKSLLIQSNTDRDRQHGELKDEIRNDKLKRLEERLEKKDAEIKEKDAWQDKLKYGSLYLVGGAALSYIVWTLQQGLK